MKTKHLFIFLWVLLCSGYGFSQNTIGVMFGFNRTKLSVNPAPALLNDTYNSETGTRLAIFTRFGKMAYIQPEISYSSKIGHIHFVSENNNYYRYDFSHFFKTIDIQLAIGYKIIHKPLYNVRIFTGPSFSYKIKENSYIRRDGLDMPDDNNFLKIHHYGAFIGVGADVSIFTLDVRYDMGLNNVENIAYGGNKKVNVLSLNLGVKIFK